MPSVTQAEAVSTPVRSRISSIAGGYPGLGWWTFEACLAGLSLFMYLLMLTLGIPNSFWGAVVVTFTIGNWSALMIGFLQPLFMRRGFPWNWIVYLPVLTAAGLLGSYVADIATFLIFHGGRGDLASRLGNNASVGTLVTLVFGTVSMLVAEKAGKLEARARELQGQVQLGHMQRRAQEAELEQAHEIQMHLLPRETPQLPGFQIACAWQPARAVSGDYFDVLPLGEGRLGLCIADVAGKGVSAALLMANLQASVKAFAGDSLSPAVLCAKLNSVLTTSIAPGKFVTFFYGVLEQQTRMLRYENAGHCLPLLVHADGTIDLPASYSGVLGLFSHWTYADRELKLERGDCLLMVTDGVLEAANAAEEEFGYQRLIESVRASRDEGAHGVRRRILEDVSAFCEGQFQDDASLIVVMVN
jgi:sigma-B regulation protein RsbU (phosphoserine phosphatase)